MAVITWGLSGASANSGSNALGSILGGMTAGSSCPFGGGAGARAGAGAGADSGCPALGARDGHVKSPHKAARKVGFAASDGGAGAGAGSDDDNDVDCMSGLAHGALSSSVSVASDAPAGVPDMVLPGVIAEAGGAVDATGDGGPSRGRLGKRRGRRQGSGRMGGRSPPPPSHHNDYGAVTTKVAPDVSQIGSPSQAGSGYHDDGAAGGGSSVPGLPGLPVVSSNKSGSVSSGGSKPTEYALQRAINTDAKVRFTCV